VVATGAVDASGAATGTVAAAEAVGLPDELGDGDRSIAAAFLAAGLGSPTSAPTRVRPPQQTTRTAATMPMIRPVLPTLFFGSAGGQAGSPRWAGSPAVGR
jgi:hypothetical protein